MKKNKSIFIVILTVFLSLLNNIAPLATESKSLESKYISTDKKAQYNMADNTISYRIAAFQEYAVVSSKKSVPLDIVLVLDLSSSMEEHFSDNGFRRIRNEINTFEQLYSMYQDVNLYKMTKDNYDQISIKKNNSKYIIEVENENKHEGSGNERLPFQIYEYVDKKSSSSLGITRMEALQVSVDRFLNILEHQSQDNKVEHRVAFVSFSGDLYADNSKGTGLLGTSKDEKFIPFYEADDLKLKESLISIKDKDKILSASSRIKSEVNYTSTHLGMDLARRIVKENEQKNRKSTVILFTDGEPNGYPLYDVSEITKKNISYDMGKDYGFNQIDSDPNYGSANEAIKQGHIIKHYYETDIFTIAIHHESSPENSIEKNKIKNNASIIDRFMHLTSSNYINEPYRKILDDFKINENKFYKDAKSANELTDIFEFVLEEIIKTEEINLNENSILYDSFPNIVNVSEIRESDITVATQDYLGENQWGNCQPLEGASVEVNEQTMSISVKGFSYTDNLVNKRFAGGKRIVVSFKAPLRDGFIGGHGIATNGTDSGIYHADLEGPVEKFPVPFVDIPLRFDIDSENHSIYLSNDFDLDDLIYKDKSFKYKIGDSEFELDGINNSYVDIKLNIMHNEEVIWEHIVAAGDVFDYEKIERDLNKFGDNTNFKINYEVISINDQDVKLSNQLDSKVYVFKPDIKSKNTESYLGEKMIFSDNFALNNIVWLAGDSSDNAPDPQEKYVKPNLDINIPEIKDFDLNQQYYWQEDEAFSYEVLLNGDNSFNKYIMPEDKVIKHKIIPVSLILEKNVDNFRADDNFKFKIRWLGTNGHYPFENVYDMDIFLKGNEQIEISGLPIGKYEVVEDTKWSWRYEAVGEVSQAKEILNDKMNYKFSFQNKLTNKKHLGKEVIINNRYE